MRANGDYGAWGGGPVIPNQVGSGVAVDTWISDEIMVPGVDPELVPRKMGTVVLTVPVWVMGSDVPCSKVLGQSGPGRFRDEPS